MTRGKWIIAVLLVVLAGLLVFTQRNNILSTEPPAPTVPPAAPDEIPPPTPRQQLAALKPAARADSNTAATQAADALKLLQVLVQDEAGRPVEGAEVRSSVRSPRGAASLTNHNGAATTTSHGLASISWPAQKELAQFEVLAAKDGFASRKMVWDIATGDSIPPTITLTLKTGVHVGGCVVDPEGNPIADARVSLGRFWMGGEQRQNKGEEAAFSRQMQTTGANGRWSARNLPAEILHRIGIDVTHSNFLGARLTIDDKPEVLQQLRDGTHRVMLKRGLFARGRVMDQQQQPIAGAQVWAGNRFTRDRQQGRTDNEGRFTFRNVSEGKVLYSVVADGFLPATKNYDVTASTNELEFVLGPGNLLRGVVKDQGGYPIAGVHVALEGSPGDAYYDGYEFSQTTGADGQFEWRSAPAEPLPFYFGKSGYQQRRGVRLTAGAENVVILRKSRQVSGQVLDQDTGQPVTRFKIAPGSQPITGRFYPDNSMAIKEYKNDEGRFTVEVEEERSVALQASADGYADQVQPMPKAGDDNAQVVFRLKPSKALEGIVVNGDGQPVAGAMVALTESTTTVMIYNGKLRNSGSRAKSATTDAAGHFSITSPGETGTVIAGDGASYASATIAEVRASGVLKLQSFGRIEGIVYRGTEPLAGQELTLSSANSGLSFQQGYRITSDADGKFAIETVPPGNFTLVRLVKMSSRSWMHSHATEVTVVPGQTTSVTLGGSDALVRGTVRLDMGSAGDDLTYFAQLSSPMPKFPEELSPQERTAYLQSPEWQAQIKNRKSFSAAIGNDGVLILDSVPPGQYTMRVTANRADDGAGLRPSTPVAEATTDVTVPDGAAANAPIEIGEIVLKSRKPAPQAQPAKEK